MISIRDLVRSKLGYDLPPAPAAVGSYAPFRHLGNQLAISGQLPLKDGVLTSTGIVGDDVDLDEAQEAARICTINIISQLSQAVDDDLGRVMGCLIIRGYVASHPQFTKHPLVINAASDMMSDILGESRGNHARAAVGMSSLPLNAPVEIEATFVTS